MKFKTWLTTNENLAGPGGGPDPNGTDLSALHRDVLKHGAGAFHQGGDEPGKPLKTATSDYLDPRFAKGMKKFMKANDTADFKNQQKRRVCKSAHQSGSHIEN